MNITIRHVSIQKKSVINAYIFLEFIFFSPIFLIEGLDLSWNRTALATFLLLGLISIPLTLVMYERVRRSAVVIEMRLKTLLIIKYGEVAELEYDIIKLVRVNQRILVGTYGRIAGITIETNLPSGGFIKTTRDFFIPDMFDVTKEELALQISEHVSRSK